MGTENNVEIIQKSGSYTDLISNDVRIQLLWDYDDDVRSMALRHFRFYHYKYRDDQVLHDNLIQIAHVENDPKNISYIMHIDCDHVVKHLIINKLFWSFVGQDHCFVSNDSYCSDIPAIFFLPKLVKMANIYGWGDIPLGLTTYIDNLITCAHPINKYNLQWEYPIQINIWESLHDIGLNLDRNVETKEIVKAYLMLADYGTKIEKILDYNRVDANLMEQYRTILQKEIIQHRGLRLEVAVSSIISENLKKE
jgi:hypothetical protein